MDNKLLPNWVIPFINSARVGTNGVTLVIVNDATGNHEYFRFRRTDHIPYVLVDVVDSPSRDFRYAGVLDEGSFRTTRYSKVRPENAEQARVILNWTLDRVVSGKDLKTVRCLHSGRCGRCGRKLLDPESLDRGLGPDCAKMSASRNLAKP